MKNLIRWSYLLVGGYLVLGAGHLFAESVSTVPEEVLTKVILAVNVNSLVLDAATLAAGLLLTVPFGLSTLPLLRRKVSGENSTAKIKLRRGFFLRAQDKA